jgi:pyridoxine 5-phosphate synthase
MCQVRLNLEMAATDEMVGIACRARPHMCTLVPEGRQEVTTEGGLDVAGQVARLTAVVAQLRHTGIAASAFIDADARQIAAARQAGFAMCEIHTGPYAAAFHAGGSLDDAEATRQLDKVAQAGKQIVQAGMVFNAGHALTYANVGAIAALPGVRQLHIGHSIIARAVFIGLRAAVAEMKEAMRQAAGTGR